MKKSLLSLLMAVALLLALVFLFCPAYATTQLTDDGYYPKANLQINNSGYVAWTAKIQEGVWGLFLYDGTSTGILTDEFDATPTNLNDSGQIAWVAGYAEARELFLYDGAGIIQLTDNDYYDCGGGINNAGHVVWDGKVDSEDYEILLYDVVF